MNEKPIPFFKRFVIQNFPFIEEDFDALTNYQLFCKVVEYLNKVIGSQNEVTQQMEYVLNYFDNLDVQDEVDQKLDEMAESGQLTDIIAAYLNLRGILAYNSVAEMKTADNLVDGSFVETYGFYAKGDLGGAKYKVRTITNADVVDEMSIIALADETLVAELMPSVQVNVKQYGAKGDDSTDDIVAIQTAINKNSGKAIYFPRGTYVITEPIEIRNDDITLYGENEKSIIKKTTNKATDYVATYKDEPFDFNEYPSIINVLFTTDTNKARVKIENLNLLSTIESPRVNYGIVAPYVSYSTIRGCRFNRLTSAIVLGGWCNTVSSCHTFICSKPFETDYALNTTIENCSSSQGSWDINGSHEVYISGTQADNGNPSFLITNSSNVTLSGCATETNSKVMINRDSKVCVIGGDYEGHSTSGVTFGGFFENTNNGSTIINGATIRFNDVAETGTPATTAIILCNTGEVIMKNPKINTPYTYTVYVANAGGKAQIDDEIWSNESFVKNVRKFSNNFTSSGGEILRLPFSYGINYMIFIKSYGSVLHTALSLNSVLNCCANASNTKNRELSYDINSNNANWTAKITATRDSDTNELVIAYAPTSGSSIKIDSTIEWYKM